jgi:DNA-binding CsgD family transcriptional regulator
MPDRDVIPGLSETDSPFLLSPRQQEVLALAAQGLTNRQIALELVIRPGTVNNHLTLAREALGALNTTHAVAIALVRGLIEIQGLSRFGGGLEEGVL